MKIIELINQRCGVPTCTVHQARLPIFQPTRRPVMTERVFENAWGRVRVKGKLGQGHEDVLEAIMFCGKRPKELGDGRIKLLVDPADVRRRARQDGTTLRRALDDLMQAIVEIQSPERLAGIGHLIDHIDFARKPSGDYVTAPNPLGGERRLWKVELGKALCNLIERDLWQMRDPEPISRLRHGISQAVARHMLTHSADAQPNGGWTLDGLLKAVGCGEMGQALRDRRRELAADAEALAALGVQVSGGRVRLAAKSVEQNRDASM
jgi:hypothetical protein